MAEHGTEMENGRAYGTIEANKSANRSNDGEYAPVRTSSREDLIEKGDSTKNKKYPYPVLFILSNEFCERFSYYGMRAILVLYFTRWLGFGDDMATSIFHTFSMLCYFMPLTGAILADGYLGRYKTILYLSCVYFLGNMILSLTAIPPPEWIGPCVGLLLIACGTGGIKSSVAPFGADQFSSGMEKWQNSFFSAFYFMINLGSMISIILTPILRADVTCFGKECYLLAFGVPAILTMMSVVLFFCGRSKYEKVPPAGNVISKTFKCIYHGFKGRISRNKYDEPKKHWLYHADDRYDSVFIEEVRQLLSVLFMFIPLPFFWALSDQQGSRWTLQAEHLDGDTGVFGTLKPDQMQALNPMLILLLIPLFDRGIYPLLDKCNLLNKPLQKMVLGLYISALAFVCAGFLQLKIDNTDAFHLSAPDTGVTFINTLPCEVDINSHLFKGKVGSLEASAFIQHGAGSYTFTLSADCLKGEKSIQKKFSFLEEKVYRMIVYSNIETMDIDQFPDRKTKPTQGNAAVSVFSSVDLTWRHVLFVKSVVSHNVTEQSGALIKVLPNTATSFKEMDPTVYTVYIPDASMTDWADLDLDLHFGSGGVYTLLITGSQQKPLVTLVTDVPENKVSILWMVPQYILITVGEVLFSISGLSFAYSQAPTSLKTVVQAMWLMTVSLGDLIVIIVANIHAIPSQMAEFFLFAVLMFVDTVIFNLMAVFYVYKANSLYQEFKNEDEAVFDSPDAPRRREEAEAIPLQNRKTK